jgi:photosystem II stability/assembly factor-like uncharacterized protein
MLITTLRFSEAHDPSAYGGLFRSRDSGATWFPANIGLFLGGALGVAVSPTDSHHLLLATDNNLLRSRNGGRDWITEAPTILFGAVYAVAFDEDGRSAFASTASGIYLTDDSSGWRKIATPEGAAPAYAIVIGSVPGRIYLAGPGGLWRSEDRGRSWSGAGEGFPEGAVNSVLLIKGSEETIYVIVGGRVWMSSGGTHSWRTSDEGLPKGRIEILSQDSGESGRLWAAATDQVFVSEDRGTTWRPVGQSLPEANTAINGLTVVEGGTIILLTTHRGLFRSADGGQNWVLMEGNLPVHLEGGPLVQDPTNPTTFYAGFALTPYTELRKTAVEGRSMLNRVDPLSLLGGAAFLTLLLILGVITVRWLARSPASTTTRPKIKETLR